MKWGGKEMGWDVKRVRLIERGVTFEKKWQVEMKTQGNMKKEGGEELG